MKPNAYLSEMFIYVIITIVKGVSDYHAPAHQIQIPHTDKTQLM